MIEPATSRIDHHMLRPYPLGVACHLGCIAARRQRQNGEQRGEPHRLRLPSGLASSRHHRTPHRSTGER
jgi:hypothetical protein